MDGMDEKDEQMDDDLLHTNNGVAIEPIDTVDPRSKRETFYFRVYEIEQGTYSEFFFNQENEIGWASKEERDVVMKLVFDEIERNKEILNGPGYNEF